MSLINFAFEHAETRMAAQHRLLYALTTTSVPLERFLLLLRFAVGTNSVSDFPELSSLQRFLCCGSRPALERIAAEFFPGKTVQQLLPADVQIDSLLDYASPDAVPFLQWLLEQTGQPRLKAGSSLLGAINAGNLPLVEFLLGPQAEISSRSPLRILSHYRPSQPTSEPNPALSAFLNHPGIKDQLRLELGKPDQSELFGFNEPSNDTISYLRAKGYLDPETLKEVEEAKRMLEQDTNYTLQKKLSLDDPDGFEAALARHESQGTPARWNVQYLLTRRRWRILKRVNERGLADLQDPLQWDWISEEFEGPEFALSFLRNCLRVGVHPPIDAVSCLLQMLSSDSSLSKLPPVAYRLLELHVHELGYNEQTLLSFKQQLGLAGDVEQL